MIEIHEKEEHQVQEEEEAAERAAHDKIMSEANLEGVEHLMDDMVT